MLKSRLLAFTRIQYDYIIRIRCQEKELYVEDRTLYKHDHFFCTLKFLYRVCVCVKCACVCVCGVCEPVCVCV